MSGTTGFEPFDPPCPDMRVPPTAQGTIFADGVPDEIEPSHVILGSENYYFSMGYQSTKFIVVIGIILIILFVIMLVAFGFYFSSNQVGFVPESATPIVRAKRVNLTQGAGASQTVGFVGTSDGTALTTPILCSNSAIATWNSATGTCVCRDPYWGSTCLRESHKPQYLGLGVVNPDNVITQDLGPPIELQRLSYADPSTGQPSCTDLCDANTLCGGVHWQRNPTVGGTCTLFSKITPKVGVRFDFDPNVDSNYYINDRLLSFEFTDRVIIYSGQLAPLWWQTPRSTFIVAIRGTRYSLTFFPSFAYNTTNMTGLYALFPFNVADFQSLVAAGSTATTYVIHPGEQLAVPIQWVGLPIWVMYDFQV
jgi:hypothetical protein